MQKLRIIANLIKESVQGNHPQYVTLAVLAGMYKGKRRSLKDTLTHTVDLSKSSTVALCNQPNMADEYSSTSAEKALPPECKKCLKKDPRF